MHEVTRRGLAAGLVVVGFLSGCSDDDAGSTKIEPASVETIPGTEQLRITLTENAAARVGVETAAVGESGEPAHTVVPYGAVVYDAAGDTWAYVNAEPLVYTRERIVIDFIEGDEAFLSEGPAVSTMVVVVGAAELYGTETGIGK